MKRANVQYDVVMNEDIHLKSKPPKNTLLHHDSRASIISINPFSDLAFYTTKLKTRKCIFLNLIFDLQHSPSIDVRYRFH